MELILKILTIATSAIGTFSIIATKTPNSSPNVILDIILQCINILGMNFGKATNEGM